MRPAAEVHEVALTIEGDGGRVDAAQDLDLEGLLALLEEADGLVPRHLLTDEGLVLLGELAHRRLDALEILGREGHGPGEIVVEAVLDGGPDGDLDPGEELRHGLGHEMRGRVTQRGQWLRGAVGLPGQAQMPVFFRIDHVFIQHLPRRAPRLRLVGRVSARRSKDKKASREWRPVMLRTPPRAPCVPLPSMAPLNEMVQKENGRLGRYRTADLYRVKVALSP